MKATNILTGLFYVMLAALLCSAVAVVNAQESSERQDKIPKRSPEILELLNAGRITSPELSADTILRILESRRVTEVNWRKDLLDEVLRTIENVKYPVQLRPVPIKGIKLNNTENYVLAVAFAQKLDKLSLKARAYKLLLASEPDRAKQLIFEMNGQLGLKSRTCDDAMTYDVGDIYTLVSKVASTAFTEKQIAEGQRAIFLLPWIENIESPTQIAPVLDMIGQFRSVDIERQMLVSGMSRALRRKFNDDRSFTTSTTWGTGLASRVQKLVSDDPEPTKSELSLAYRDFLVKNLTDTRCSDNVIQADQLPQFIEAANKLFPQKPLTDDDIVSSDQGGTVKIVDLLAKSTSIQKIRSDLAAVKGAGPDGKRIETPDQANPEWQGKVLELADRILSWQGENDETESQIFMVRAGMFLGLLEEIKAPDLRKTAVRKYMAVLNRSSMQTSNFIEWYYFANQIRQSSPDLFAQLAPGFANPSFKVMVEIKKLDTLSSPKPQVKQ